MPLPQQLSEAQSALLDEITAAQAALARIMRYYRGHDKDTQTLEHISTQLYSAHTAAAKLEWPATRTSAEWDQF